MKTRPGKPVQDPQRRAQLIAELRRDQAVRKNSYREQALKILPHVCGRCGREFEGARLRELTVHHKDHNFKNNPPDGSNWEMLCIYCHDDEHEKYLHKDYHGKGGPSTVSLTGGSGLGNPFDALDTLTGGNPGKE